MSESVCLCISGLLQSVRQRKQSKECNNVAIISVSDTTCIKPAKLKSWQRVSATTRHHQAKNRMKWIELEWLKF